MKRAILDVVEARCDVKLVLVFGSHARGTAQFDSDLDVAMDAGHTLTSTEKMDLITALADKTGRPIDLVDLSTVGEPLLGQILGHGKRIFGSDISYANLIRRHVFEQADFVPYRNRILAERRRAWTGK